MLDKNVLDRENTTANVVYRHLLLTIVIQSCTTIRRPKVNGALVDINIELVDVRTLITCDLDHVLTTRLSTSGLVFLGSLLTLAVALSTVGQFSISQGENWCHALVCR
jgi:hypothetical protein